MVEELQGIERNNTWELVEFPAHTKAIKVKYVFKLKRNVGGSIARHNERLVARVSGSSLEILSKFKELMKKEFEMSDLRILSYFLGMEFQISKQGMMLCQRKYVKEIIKRFHMDDLTPTSSPVEQNLKLEKHGEEDKVDATLFKQIVGSLRYVCNNRPDIGFSVG
ncbi:uncharacterized mitochondrial protein AtMg00810-like [Lathyrus oleraceus]|uniref:uncharacterized mitochondrial protein AtMg00810-like n=1 Tax=Pisum sativum TaxID=3888 RepID=UPI0021D012BA|nr:uncharacterized mitochondrial protein AtMg00810-like [Pisum sativum]